MFSRVTANMSVKYCCRVAVQIEGKAEAWTRWGSKGWCSASHDQTNMYFCFQISFLQLSFSWCYFKDVKLSWCKLTPTKNGEAGLTQLPKGGSGEQSNCFQWLVFLVIYSTGKGHSPMSYQIFLFAIYLKMSSASVAWHPEIGGGARGDPAVRGFGQGQ